MKAVNKNFNSPEETRNIEKGKISVLDLGGSPVMKARFEPGWRWSECVKPVAGGESCQTSHLMYTLKGKMTVRMDDGTEFDINAGDATFIPPGHDAWIVGDEAFEAVDFQGAATYAKPAAA
jgi:hypothetical protein